MARFNIISNNLYICEMMSHRVTILLIHPVLTLHKEPHVHLPMAVTVSLYRHSAPASCRRLHFARLGCPAGAAFRRQVPGRGSLYRHRQRLLGSPLLLILALIDYRRTMPLAPLAPSVLLHHPLTASRKNGETTTKITSTTSCLLLPVSWPFLRYER